jgi:hypothetical protein
VRGWELEAAVASLEADSGSLDFSFPGTSVPGIHMPPLRGYGVGAAWVAGCRKLFACDNAYETFGCDAGV